MKKKCTIVIAVTSLLCSGAMAQQPQQPPKPPTAEERLKHVSEKIGKEITLTTAQKTKVESAFKEFFMSMEKLRKEGKPESMPPPPPPPPGKKEDIDKLSKIRDDKIKAALSPTQFKKYVEVEKTLRPPAPRQ